jgi:hypothetical protein
MKDSSLVGGLKDDVGFEACRIPDVDKWRQITYLSSCNNGVKGMLGDG